MAERAGLTTSGDPGVFNQAIPLGRTADRVSTFGLFQIEWRTGRQLAEMRWVFDCLPGKLRGDKQLAETDHRHRPDHR
jgi:hypothetical protein